MNSLGICAKCRHRIKTQALGHISAHQWPSRATFVSLTPEVPADDKYGKALPSTGLTGSRSKPNTKIKSTGKPLLRRTPGAAYGNGEKLLESLFSQSLTGPPPPRRSRTANLELYGYVETLKTMLEDPGRSIGDTWLFFITHLGPDVWRTDDGLISRPSTFHSSAKTLFDKLLGARQQFPISSDVPTVTEITECFAALGLLHPSQWNSMLSTLLRPKPASTISKDRDQADDLLGTWKVLYDLNNRSVGSQEAWSYLQNINPSDISRAKKEGGLQRVYKAFLPQNSRVHSKSMTSSATLTFSLLMDQPFCKDHPFIMAIAKALYLSRPNPMEVNDLLLRQDASILEDLKIDVSYVLGRANEMAKTGPRPRNSSYSRGHGVGSEATYRKLSHAFSTRDLYSVDILWDEFKKLPYENPMALQLYNKFITVYMGLRQADRAIDVWNHMIQSSITPTLTTWNAMLEGCKIARSPSSLEGVWTKLIDSGLRPDKVCWTTRIACLVDCGMSKVAIGALEQMGRDWEHAAKKVSRANWQSVSDVDGIIKPTIEIINAAITGLLRKHQNEAAHDVLAWGAKLGIKPDIVTFNTLLRPVTKENKEGAVREFLKEMEAQGTRPDVATFTTILEETLRLEEGLSGPEQIEIVDTALTEMEVAGIAATEKTYGTIIYSLLKSHPNEIIAVRAVMARMASQGIHTSAHIYTMLVMHYFAQAQPDFEAIKSLLERVRLPNASTDHIFWDRVIEGYARAKDTSSAVKILSKVDKEGSRVGWTALEAVVLALVENGEVDLANDIVKNVKNDRGGPLPYSEKGVEGQHSFWGKVQNLGLVVS